MPTRREVPTVIDGGSQSNGNRRSHTRQRCQALAPFVLPADFIKLTVDCDYARIQHLEFGDERLEVFRCQFR